MNNYKVTLDNEEIIVAESSPITAIKRVMIVRGCQAADKASAVPAGGGKGVTLDFPHFNKGVGFFWYHCYDYVV